MLATPHCVITLALGLVPVAFVAGGCANDAAPKEGTLELGSGESEFAPIEDGAHVDLVRGAQGGYHVWLSMRATGLAPKNVRTHVTAERDADDLMLSESRVALQFTPVAAETPTIEFAGWPTILTMPACAVGQLLRIHVELQDAEGARAAATRFVVPEGELDSECEAGKTP